MKQMLRKKDVWVLLAALIGAFACVTLIQFISGRIDGVASMVFLLAVIFVSMYTDGYWWGVAGSVISVLAVNFALRAPYFAFNFTIPEHIFSGVVMLVVSFMTSTLTTRIKMQEQLRQDELAQQQYKNEQAQQEYQDKLRQQQVSNALAAERLNLSKSQWAAKQEKASRTAEKASADAAAKRGSLTGDTGLKVGKSGVSSGGTVPYSAARMRSQGRSDTAIRTQLLKEGYSSSEVRKIMQQLNS